MAAPVGVALPPRRKGLLSSKPNAYNSRMINNISPAILVPVDALTPDPANVRRHPGNNLEAIKASLKRFGQQKPLVVDAADIIRAGNGTWAAAKALGWQKIWIIKTDLSGSDAVAYAIADNRTAELAQWDSPALADQLSALDAHLQLAAGFTPEEMTALTTGLDPAPADNGGEVPLRQIFEVAVECHDEDDQREIYARLTQEGRKCRVLTL
ncbi:MAG: ParB N-terminal domain-containing protein [Planctomycetia bacterium]|nr:ParB N-terminal domain-containing protein [Planctomycetia bacterium]